MSSQGLNEGRQGFVYKRAESELTACRSWLSWPLQKIEGWAALSRRHLGAPRYFLFEIPLQLSQLADS